MVVVRHREPVLFLDALGHAYNGFIRWDPVIFVRLCTYKVINFRHDIYYIFLMSVKYHNY